LFYHPALSLRFDPNDGQCIAEASETRWARLSVKNSGKIHLKECQALVTKIEQERNGIWEHTDPQFIEPLVLEWAAMPDEVKYKPQQIPQKIELYANFLASSATSDDKNKLRLSVYHLPDRIKDIFAEYRRYQLTITVTGDQVKPKTERIIVNWTGNWRFDTSRG
jgi:hypothetical protein